MRKIFMLSILLGLFSATSLHAQEASSLEDQARRDSQLAQVHEADALALQMANIGKYGKIKLKSGTYSIVDVTSPREPGGLTVYSMDPEDPNHRTFRTLFWGVVLKRRKINKTKFWKALQDPSTIIDCKGKSPKYLPDMVDSITCQSNFSIKSDISISMGSK